MPSRENDSEFFSMDGDNVQLIVRERKTDEADVDRLFEQALNLTDRLQVDEVECDLRAVPAKCERNARHDFERGRRNKAHTDAADLSFCGLLHTLCGETCLIEERTRVIEEERAGVR